jgi:hypothetical protein
LPFGAKIAFKRVVEQKPFLLSFFVAYGFLIFCLKNLKFGNKFILPFLSKHEKGMIENTIFTKRLWEVFSQSDIGSNFTYHTQ